VFPVCDGEGGVGLAGVVVLGVVEGPATASVPSVVEDELEVWIVELTPVVFVTVLLLLLFLIVPPTAPPTTAPTTTRTMTTRVMMPLRVRQKDVRGLGADGGYAGELNFSAEAASGMAGVNGTATGGGWGDCDGGGLRVEGVRRTGCSARRSTL